MKKTKCYSNGKKKKEILDITKNGHEFKLIINYDLTGNVSSVMEKPDLRVLEPNVLASGAHVFASQEHNHCDFFQSGALVFREYPKIKGSTNYGYTISGAVVII